MSIHLSNYIYSIYRFLAVYLSPNISIYRYIHISIYLSIHISIYISIYQSIYLSIYVYIYLSFYWDLEPQVVINHPLRYKSISLTYSLFTYLLLSFNRIGIYVLTKRNKYLKRTLLDEQKPQDAMDQISEKNILFQVLIVTKLIYNLKYPSVMEGLGIT